MSGRKRLIRFVLILIVAGVAYWQRGHLPSIPTDTPNASPRERGRAVPKDGPGGGTAETKEVGPTKVRGYDRFSDARLVDQDGNDGDSFLIRAGGREFELRLYFVDAPESYLSDRYENQQRRVADQARDLGGISPEEAVAAGKVAKNFVQGQLSGSPFTVYTSWEQVFDGDRFYGFVELADGSDLGTRLVEEGLVRIHTKGPGSKEKPVPTPHGATFFQARDKLESLERQAQRANRGVWGL